MMETTIVEKRKLKTKNGILITGLPGIGLIGRVVGRYMAEELKAEKIAELYSPHFPHQVFMTKKGGLRLIKNRFYYIKGKTDVVILIGDVQAVTSNGQYEVADAILEYAKKIGIKTIITVGGYSTGEIKDKKEIYGVATDKKLLARFKKGGVIFGKVKGSIVGAAGLLPALGKLKGLQGACIMGETHGAYVDVVSAKNIVELLSKFINAKINLKKLEKRAVESEKVLKKIEEEIEKHTIPQSEATQRQVSYIR